MPLYRTLRGNANCGVRVIKHVTLAEADSNPCPWKMSSKCTKFLQRVQRQWSTQIYIIQLCQKVVSTMLKKTYVFVSGIV